jgi:hypothetical protein
VCLNNFSRRLAFTFIYQTFCRKIYWKGKIKEEIRKILCEEKGNFPFLLLLEIFLVLIKKKINTYTERKEKSIRKFFLVRNMCDNLHGMKRIAKKKID